jgi:hypothetical protein
VNGASAFRQKKRRLNLKKSEAAAVRENQESGLVEAVRHSPQREELTLSATIFPAQRDFENTPLGVRLISELSSRSWLSSPWRVS